MVNRPNHKFETEKKMVDATVILTTKTQKNDAFASAKQMTPEDTTMYIDVIRQGLYHIPGMLLKIFCVRTLVFWSMVR